MKAAMTILPILVKPKVTAIKNRWFRSGRNSLKELITVALSLVLIWAIYVGTLAGLKDAEKALATASVDPAMPLSVLLSALFAMIVVSAGVTALGALFLARDLDLTLSAPITPNQFLAGKTVDVGFAVSWMVITLGLPSLLAFGSFYHAGYEFFLLGPLILAAFLAIAVLLGMIGALLFAAILPSNRAKQLLAGLIFVALGGILATQRGGSALLNFDPSASSTQLFTQIATITTNPYLPSFHAAEAITSLMRGTPVVALYTNAEFLGIMGLLWLTLSLAFRTCYERGMSHMRAGAPLFKIHSRSSQRMARILFPLSSPATRAIVSKEYKVFSRDITHTIQLGMLLGITFVYLYNYRFLTAPTKMSDEVVAVWHIFLLISNVALGSLVLTSICSRFVYPSVSLEGTAFWLIQAAPISLRQLLTAKFKSWLIPISLIGGVIFVSGAMALNADGPLVIASCVAGMILCHGLVGLGIGLGAMFSQFEWEHSTQLAMSVGSFIFMLTSMIFVGVNLVPIGLMFGAYVLFPENTTYPYFSTLVITGGLLSTYLLNRIATWWALAAGARALQPR